MIASGGGKLAPSPCSARRNRARGPSACNHAVWALRQVGALSGSLAVLLAAPREIRAQGIRAIGDLKLTRGYKNQKLVPDRRGSPHASAPSPPSPPGNSAIAARSQPPSRLLRKNNNRDLNERHAAVFALRHLLQDDDLETTPGTRSAAVRLGVLLALRRQENPRVADFLDDADPTIVAEAIRAINDLDIAPPSQLSPGSRAAKRRRPRAKPQPQRAAVPPRHQRERPCGQTRERHQPRRTGRQLETPRRLALAELARARNIRCPPADRPDARRLPTTRAAPRSTDPRCDRSPHPIIIQNSSGEIAAADDAHHHDLRYRARPQPSHPPHPGLAPARVAPDRRAPAARVGSGVR